MIHVTELAEKHPLACGEQILHFHCMDRNVAKKRPRISSRSPAAQSSGLKGCRAVDLVMQLMAIPGKSGQEGQVAEFIKRQLRAGGAPSSAIRIDAANRRTRIGGDTGNLVLRLPGTVRQPRRLMMAHMDTVPLCVGSKPVLRKGLIVSADPKTGLGADDRAGVAVVLWTALEIVRRKLPHPPLTFFWSIQEEIGLEGARHVRLSLCGQPQLAFNWDGGAPHKVTVGATGGYRMSIEVKGIASHAGSSPEYGVSAIAIASLAIADLQRSGWHGNIHKDGKHGTSNVGYIHGGESSNVVTDHVVLKAEARSHAPKFRKKILNRIEQAFTRAAKAVRNIAGASGEIDIEGHLDYESFRLADDQPSVLAAEQAVRSIGRQPERAVSNGGLDANWMVRHGIPTVTIGCGQLNQHTLSEALEVAAFEDACRIALRLATATEC